MGCAASKAAAASPPPAAESTVAVPKPVAFEIPVVEPEAAKRLPPQLQQRLEEQSGGLTAEDIKQKQQKAEERRQTILEEKARIARQAQKMFSKGEPQEQPDGEQQKQQQAEES